MRWLAANLLGKMSENVDLDDRCFLHNPKISSLLSLKSKETETIDI